MTEPAKTSRRGLLVGGLGLAGAYTGLRYGSPAISERLLDLEFEPLDEPAGFRRLVTTGSVTGGTTFDPFIGLDAPDDRVAPSCAGLFAAGSPPGLVPVASFSDYNCAYCRSLSPRLAALDGVRITWHELPLLGAASVLTARAALAAGLQDAYAPFHAAMMKAPRPSANTVARIVTDLNLDAVRLQADMDGSVVEASLSRSAAIAARFGVNATPALVVGRTLVIGAVSRVILDRLIAREREDGRVPDCT